MTNDTTTLAAIGAAVIFTLMFAYFSFLGYIAARPTKLEAAILARSLEATPRSVDAIMAAKEERLLKALNKRKDGLF